MKYPFQPEVLDALPEELAELFRGLEDTLLDEICSRLALKDQLNEVTVQAIRALRSHGIDTKEIEKQSARLLESARRISMSFRRCYCQKPEVLHIGYRHGGTDTA